jgi:group I intron endonuclease
MLVYKITNKINGMLYIGITTKSVEARWKRHLAWSNWSKPYSLHHAIKDFGVNNFLIDTIATASSLKELKDLEKKFIQQYDSLKPNGYNMTRGGQGVSGYKFTDEVRKVMSDKAKCRPSISPETRLKLSLSRIGKAMPREGVEKARAARIGQIRSFEQKLSMSQGRRKYSEELIFRAVSFIKQGIKQSEIVKLTGLSQSYVSRLTSGQHIKYLQGA